MDLHPSCLALAPGLSRAYLLHHRLCPQRFDETGALVVLAASDAFLEDALDDLRFLYHCDVRTEQGTSGEVEQLIERSTADLSTSTIEIERADVGGDTTVDVRDLANQPPVIRYVNLLVRDAHDAGASDIHLEATRSGLAARFRLDGVLTSAIEPQTGTHHAVISRIKLLAELDIAERRRPQDGRIRVRMDARELDLRVSTVPTLFGESVVLRLLDRGGRPVGLDELGMSECVHMAMARLAAKPHGMLLVTGPTGSGKTTTLYAALGRREAHAEKIITVEDPVEYQLEGITQVPVHRQAGVTFGSALRSILRQDPDVVMIGEMRDSETAEIAVQAAMTGHLVFSTLHTNDAVGAVARLLDLSIAEYLVTATVEAVLAQRLVRRLCGDCRIQYTPDRGHIGLLWRDSPAPTHFERGAGCARCRGTGFRGRTGLFELMVMSDAIKDAVATRASQANLRELALREGLVPLREDGARKVEACITTVEEVLRVAQD